MTDRRAKLRGPEVRTAALPEDFWRQVAALFKDYVQRQLEPLRAELVEVRKELAAHEYKGTWQADTTYAKHNFTTHGGSLWIATRETRARPGNGPDWRLAVKKGRDAR